MLSLTIAMAFGVNPRILQTWSIPVRPEAQLIAAGSKAASVVWPQARGSEAWELQLGSPHVKKVKLDGFLVGADAEGHVVTRTLRTESWYGREPRTLDSHRLFGWARAIDGVFLVERPEAKPLVVSGIDSFVLDNDLAFSGIALFPDRKQLAIWGDPVFDGAGRIEFFDIPTGRKHVIDLATQFGWLKRSNQDLVILAPDTIGFLAVPCPELKPATLPAVGSSNVPGLDEACICTLSLESKRLTPIARVRISGSPWTHPRGIDQAVLCGLDRGAVAVMSGDQVLAVNLLDADRRS